MKQKWDGIERRQSLREKAEAMVASLSPEAMKTQPAEMLLHELLVHKIELEMQNEELQRTHAVIAESRDRYQDLYEFAPTAYIVVDAEDRIDEINLAGAALFGIDRHRLPQPRFSIFVADAHRDRWYLQCRDLMDTAEPERRSLELEMMRPDGTRFFAHLDCSRRELGEQPPVLLVSLTETDEAQIEPKTRCASVQT